MGSGEDSAEGAKEKKPPEEGEADRRETEGAGREAPRREPRKERGGESSDERASRASGRAGEWGGQAGRGGGPGLAGGAPTDPCRRLLPSQAALSSPTASVSQR